MALQPILLSVGFCGLTAAATHVVAPGRSVQKAIATISPDPPVHPITMWYGGTPDDPGAPRVIDFPKICGIVIDINADNAARKAPHRPAWPKELGKRWAGLDARP